MIPVYILATNDVDLGIRITERNEFTLSSRGQSLLHIQPSDDFSFKLLVGEGKYVAIDTERHFTVVESTGRAARFFASPVSGFDRTYHIESLDFAGFFLRSDRRKLRLSNAKDASFDFETSFRLLNSNRSICRFPVKTVCGKGIVNFRGEPLKPLGISKHDSTARSQPQSEPSSSISMNDRSMDSETNLSKIEAELEEANTRIAECKRQYDALKETALALARETEAGRQECARLERIIQTMNVD